MILFKKIRLKLANAILRKRKKRTGRIKQVQNFKTAKTGCIVFDGTDTSQLNYLKKIKKHLESHEIQVHFLGFVDSDIIPSEYLLFKNSLVINKNDLDLFFIPKKDINLKFLKNHFDLLIDLSIKDYMPLRYLTVLSNSSFKVGKYTEMLNDYDLMINIKEDDTVEYLGDQILFYVGRLNNPLESPVPKSDSVH